MPTQQKQNNQKAGKYMTKREFWGKVFAMIEADEKSDGELAVKLAYEIIKEIDAGREE